MVMVSPCNEAFVNAVRLASAALELPLPDKVIAVCDDKLGKVVKLIDVSSKDHRQIAVLDKKRVDPERNLIAAIGKLFPFRRQLKVLTFRHQHVGEDNEYRWVLWDPENDTPRNVDGTEVADSYRAVVTA